jgi:hypothetical protein
LTKSLCLTVPVVDANDVDVLTPGPEWLKLVGTHPEMLYGLHGSTASKQPVLSAAFAEADKKGHLTDQKEMFYLIDLTYRAPEGLSDEDPMLYGHLPANMLKKAPFIVARRLSADAAVELGELWYKCAKEEFGLRKVAKEEVNWAQPASYMMAFPTVVAGIFKQLPKLRCLLMPMETQLLPVGKNVCWVGVSPRSKTKANKVEAEVRYKAHIKVNLKLE